MRGFEDIGSKGHFSAKKGCFLGQPPWGQPLGGSQKNFRVKITSKMNSAPSNYSSANFQQNLTTFKNHYTRGIFNILGGKKAPPRGELEFSSR